MFLQLAWPAPCTVPACRWGNRDILPSPYRRRGGAITDNAHGVRIVGCLYPDFIELLQQRSQMTRFAGHNVDVTARESARHDEGPGLDSIRDNAVLSAVQLVNPLHPDGRGAGTFNAGTHLVEQVGQIGDL